MTASALLPCVKCSGSGVLRRLMRVDNGRCYECDGAGVVEVTARPVHVVRVTQDRVDRAVLDLMTMLRNAKAHGRGFALIDADSVDGTPSVGAMIAGNISILPAARGTKCLACFAAVLGASDMVEIESHLARIGAKRAALPHAAPCQAGPFGVPAFLRFVTLCYASHGVTMG